MHNTFNKFIWKTKIDISDFTEDESHFITLREPNTAEFKVLLKVQNGLINSEQSENVEEVIGILENFGEIASTIIIDHDFFTDGQSPEKLPSKEIAEFLKSKIALTKYVMGEYLSKVPLQKASGKK